MSKDKVLALTKGSVLHIEDYKGLVLESKDKYIFLIGHEDPATVLGFVISSQAKWAKHERLSREQVHIAVGTLATLPKDSWIQCFYEVHRLSVAELQAGFARFEVKNKGKLPPEFLKRVRSVVECSDVLSHYEIQDCMAAIDSDKSKG